MRYADSTLKPLLTRQLRHARVLLLRWDFGIQCISAETHLVGSAQFCRSKIYGELFIQFLTIPGIGFKKLLVVRTLLVPVSQ